MKTYNKGDIIFRQGDAAESMFDITWGRVGIYLDYGTEKEKLLTELGSGSTFGEMGMIDHDPRSATAVALEDRTQLAEITEDMLGALFQEQPAKVLRIMQQLSSRLRGLTGDYLEACKTADGIVKIEEQKKLSAEAAQDVQARIDYFANAWYYGHYIYH